MNDWVFLVNFSLLRARLDLEGSQSEGTRYVMSSFMYVKKTGSTDLDGDLHLSGEG